MKKSKLSTILFIVFSLSVLAVFSAVIFIFSPNRILELKRSAGGRAGDLSQNNDKYYFNENYNSGDPLITRNPDLESILAGPIVTVADPSQGSEDAAVTVVEFADFKCHFCYRQEQVLKRLVQRYKNKVRLIWKDYPKNDKNSDSFQAAMAARCAAEQGMFWPFHDLLFDSGGNLSEERYYKIVEILGLNKTAFRECFISGRSAGLIRDNIAEANALDIHGIPFIYINKQEVAGEASYDDLERMVSIELNRGK